MADVGHVSSPSRFNPTEGCYADPSMTALEQAATAWLDGFYQLEHLLSARAWAIRIAGHASPELRFAALVHDAERFFPGGPSGMPQDGFDDPDYLFAHSTRSADIVDRWLSDRGENVPLSFRKRVRALILRHEIGGNPEEDILQAADSLAFLSTFDWLVVEWVRSGNYAIAGAREKLDWMLTRIRIPFALTLALPYYIDIVGALANASLADNDLADRRKIAGSRKFLMNQRT